MANFPDLRCLACRLYKTECHGRGFDVKCQRCAEKGLDCEDDLPDAYHRLVYYWGSQMGPPASPYADHPNYSQPDSEAGPSNSCPDGTALQAALMADPMVLATPAAFHPPPVPIDPGPSVNDWRLAYRRCTTCSYGGWHVSSLLPLERLYLLVDYLQCLFKPGIRECFRCVEEKIECLKGSI
ncbi:hypothetical protein C8F01DRAFT_1188962 [Mycena amicta]|nr:hypothetical protein C8F01DRAFT_1188962 [Mycena amicta]